MNMCIMQTCTNIFVDVVAEMRVVEKFLSMVGFYFIDIGRFTCFRVGACCSTCTHRRQADLALVNCRRTHDGVFRAVPLCLHLSRAQFFLIVEA